MTVTELVHRYFDLAPQSDREAYFAQFAPDAVVEDEGRTRTGIDEIRAWRTEVPLVTYTVQDIKRTDEGQNKSTDEGQDARVLIAGDFPGSPVALVFHFEFAGPLIKTLSIRNP
jgi:hypothetical protein